MIFVNAQKLNHVTEDTCSDCRFSSRTLSDASWGPPDTASSSSSSSSSYVPSKETAYLLPPAYRGTCFKATPLTLSPIGWCISGDSITQIVSSHSVFCGVMINNLIDPLLLSMNQKNPPKKNLSQPHT